MMALLYSNVFYIILLLGGFGSMENTPTGCADDLPTNQFCTTDFLVEDLCGPVFDVVLSLPTHTR